MTATTNEKADFFFVAVMKQDVKEATQPNKNKKRE